MSPGGHGRVPDPVYLMGLVLITASGYDPDGIASAQVDEATEFQPEVRGEVGAFAWHYLAHLPASEEASMHYNNTEGARHRFFQVGPQLLTSYHSLMPFRPA